MAKSAPKFVVTGIDGLDAAIRDLRAGTGTRIAKQSGLIAMLKILDAAKQAVPKDTGAYAADLELRKPKTRKGVVRIAVVATSALAKETITEHAKHRGSYYPAAVEYGVSGTRRAPGGQLRRVADSLGPEVVDDALRRIDSEVRKALERQAKRLARQAAKA
jgi:hypothetical protein